MKKKTWPTLDDGFNILKIEKDKPDFSNNVYKSMYEQGWGGSFKNSLMNTTERNKQDMGTKRLEKVIQV